MSKDVGGHDPDSKVGSSGVAEDSIESKLRSDRIKAPQFVGDQARPFKPVVYVDSGMAAMFRKRGRKFIIGGALFLTFFLWWGFRPLYGTVHVGICRTMIQLQLKYPETLRVTAVEWFKNELRFFVTFIDPFGQNRSEMFGCVFNPDLTLIDMKINGTSIGVEKVAAFNKTISMVIAASPDLQIAPPPTTDLLGLKKD